MRLASLSVETLTLQTHLEDPPRTLCASERVDAGRSGLEVLASILSSANCMQVASQTLHPRRRRCRDDAATAEEAAQTQGAAEPPVFPESVVVFAPDDANITETMAARSEVLNDRARGHFSSERLAFLFRPGRYDVEAKIGYYTSVTGLGASPDEVVFAGARGIYVDAMDPQQAGSLDTFWRSGDNFRHEAAAGFRWAVSQAAPLRRIHAAGDLELFDPTAQVNYASGGYLGNSIVEGNFILGISAAVDLAQHRSARRYDRRRLVQRLRGLRRGRAGPSAAGAEPRVSVVDQAPVIAAKPYLVIDDVGRYTLRVPLVAKDVVGAALDAPYRDVPFERVFVADASRRAHALSMKRWRVAWTSSSRPASSSSTIRSKWRGRAPS